MKRFILLGILTIVAVSQKTMAVRTKKMKMDRSQIDGDLNINNHKNKGNL